MGKNYWPATHLQFYLIDSSITDGNLFPVAEQYSRCATEAILTAIFEAIDDFSVSDFADSYSHC